MNVAVHHILTGGFAAVDSHIETRHCRVRFVNHGTRFGKQLMTGT
jgi:hypothetical protein